MAFDFMLFGNIHHAIDCHRHVDVINKALVTCCSFAVEMPSVGWPAHIIAAFSVRRFRLNA